MHTEGWRRSNISGLTLQNNSIANKENRRLGEPVRLNSHIFVNISDEFQTPLNLPGETTVSLRDSRFIQKLLAIIERNINNSDFCVKYLVKELIMSRSQIHRKLKAIFNMSANNLIRSVRMQKAMELIRRDAGTISEIAYLVGYDDPGYFSKSFRAFFGILPSEVRKVITDRRHTDSI